MVMNEHVGGRADMTSMGSKGAGKMAISTRGFGMG